MSNRPLEYTYPLRRAQSAEAMHLTSLLAAAALIGGLVLALMAASAMLAEAVL